MLQTSKKILPALTTCMVLSACFLSPLKAQDSYAAQDTGIPGENTAQHNQLVLRLLDKITARVTEVELKIGDEYHFGTLAIVPRYCRTRPPVEPPETFAYLEIDDVSHNGTRKRVFEGWMLASSPALNALEHPVYDVWVIRCNMSSPERDTSN